MKSNFLKKIQFMTKNRYSSIIKNSDNLYLVEFKPDLCTFPDYNKGVGINANTTYIVGNGVLANYKSGWFRIGFNSISWHGQNPQLIITINGQTFYASYACAFTMIYLTIGDTFACNSIQSNVNAKFFPVKET